LRPYDKDYYFLAQYGLYCSNFTMVRNIFIYFYFYKVENHIIYKTKIYPTVDIVTFA